MRTRTNLYMEEGSEGFLRILKNFYPVGTAEIVFDLGKDVSDLAKCLNNAGYHVITTPENEYCGREFFAVAAGKKSFLKVRRRAKGKFAVYADFVTADIFSVAEPLAEFVYCDSKEYSVENKARCDECYVALLCAVAEGLSVYYGGRSRPFVDKGLKRLLEKGRTLLIGEGERDGFIKDCLAACKEIAEKLTSGGKREFLTTKMAECAGGNLAAYAESACFLNRSLILFTKWNFRDMLITAEKPAEGNSYSVDDLIIGESEMQKIFSFVADCRKRAGLMTLIDIFGKSVSANDAVFAEIYNRGIYEGIRNYG